MGRLIVKLYCDYDFHHKYSINIILICYHQRTFCSLCFGSSLLHQALYQLYFDPDMEHKNVAQKWLTQAQASAQAWQFCWALLGPDKVCCCASAGQMSVLIRTAKHDFFFFFFLASAAFI